MKKRTVLHFVFVACTLALSANVALAGNWDIKSSIKQEASYHSNPQMLINNEEEIYGSITTPSISLESKTPTSTIFLKSSVAQNLFNESEYNSTDFYSSARLKRKIERWEAGLNAGFNYDTTRSSELTTFGVDTLNERHWGFNIAPEITFTPSTKNRITLSGGLNTSRYDNSTLHTDYNVYSAGFSWGHMLSQFSTGFFSLNARRYQTQNNLDETVDSIGPSLGWKMVVSEKLTTMLTIGSEASRQKSKTTTTTHKWIWNSIFSGSVNYKDEQHNLTVKVSRQQQPYSNGSSSLLTSLSFDERYHFNEKFTGNVSAEYQDSKKSSLSSSNLKSRIYSNAGITYHLTKQADLGASYKYKQEKLTNSSSTQKDNAFLLRVRYRPTF